MADVVPLPGVTLPDMPVEPVAAVVDVLETALAEALAGKVVAVAVAFVRPNGVCSDEYAMEDGRVHDLVAAATYLQHRIVGEVLTVTSE